MQEKTEVRDIIRQVRKIEIKTRHLVDGLIAGSYHSIFRGQGIEFSEIREYRPGDDVRAIDWKVTARFNKPFIKEFIEERDLRVYFAFDMSSSGYFGNLVEKRRKAIELTATLMFSAVRNNDNAGLFIFTDEVERYFPAKKGRRHALSMISSLVSFAPSSKRTDIGRSLSGIGNVLRKRSIIFVISDFYDRGFSRSLRTLRNRHDVIAVKVSDRREMEIPDVGLIQLEDTETGEQMLLDTSDPEFRRNYKNIMGREQRRLEGVFRKCHIDAVEIVSDEPYEIPLQRFFRQRERRMA
jgi:uncharacterized protein (DUF58 family)